MIDMDDNEPEEPMVLFAGKWIPAHLAWKKMQTATVVADVIERFNQGFPGLSTEDTRDVVPLVRQRLKDIHLRMPTSHAKSRDLSPLAQELLDTMSPEAAIDTLREKHGVNIEISQFIQLVGDQNYLEALRREATDFELNQILPRQTAQLWNESSRPAPGGGIWTEDKIQKLISGVFHI